MHCMININLITDLNWNLLLLLGYDENNYMK